MLITTSCAGGLGDGRLLLGGAGDLLGLLRQDQLNVARAAHVRVDATVGTVRAAAHGGGTVHLLSGADVEVSVVCR